MVRHVARKVLELDERRRHQKSTPEWHVRRGKLTREWTFKDFSNALGFLDRVGAIAEKMDHHPDMHLTDYKEVRVETTTHDAGGLTAKDFELAAAIDELDAPN